MRHFLIAATLALALVPGVARAESFTGTYTGQSEDGQNTLTVKQAADGTVTGTHNFAGTKLEFSGKVTGDRVKAVGMLAGIPIRFAVTLYREGGKLVAEVAELGPDGQPEREGTDRILFTRQGAPPPDEDKPAAPETKPSAPPAGGKPNPLAKPAAASADPLVGKFTSKNLTAEIVGAGPGKYRGTLTLDGTAFPFTAAKDGPGIVGAFTSGGDKFEFLAKIEGEALQLKTGDTVYIMLRQGPPPAPAKPANPLDKKSAGDGSAAPVAKASAGASAPDPAWKVLSHPAGISLRYPKDWEVKSLPDGVYQFIPPGASNNEEVYILSGIPADGVQDASDPRVAQAAETLMSKLAPALQRVGPVEQLKAGDVPAIALSWEGGPNGNGGARMYVIILKGAAIGLTGLGAKEKIAARDPVLKKLFTSFAQGEGKRDPALVGAWSRLGTTELTAKDSAGKIQASSAGDHRRTIQLNPDGTCISREVDRTIAIGQGVALDTGEQVTTKNGRWFGGDGKLVLMWEKDAEEYEYRLVGQPGARQLVFVLGNGKGQVWQGR